MRSRMAFRTVSMSAIAAAAILGFPSTSRAAESSAVALIAHFDQGAEATALGGIGTASGMGWSAYKKVAKVNSAQQSLLIQGGQLPLPEMSVNVSGVTDTATSPGTGVDAISSEADSAIGSASVVLTGYQCPACATPVIDYLGVQTSNVSVRSNFQFTAPNFLSLSGTTELGSVTLSGVLLHGKTITYPGGSPSPNTILYKDGATEQTSTIVVKLNRQQEAGTVAKCGGGPSSKCSFKPSNIATTAIYLQLHGAMIAGKPVTGIIEIGRTFAQ
jgi:hypothetical protein